MVRGQREDPPRGGSSRVRLASRRGILAACLGIAVATTAAASAPAEGGGDRALFYEASRVAGAGDAEGAIAGFTRLRDEYPASEFADDALYRIAELLDRALFRHDAALVEYGRVVRDYPGSAFAARARARMLELEEGLRSGAEPLRQYEETLARYPDRPVDESIARMERLRTEYPDFVRLPDVLLWLGSEYARRPDGEALARERFDEVRRRWPTGAPWYGATAGLAELDRQAGRYEGAKALYLEIGEKASSPRERDAGRQYARQMDAHLTRRGIFYGFAALLVAGLLIIAVRVPWTSLSWARVRGVRMELALTVPLFAGLLALAWGRGAIARASVALIGLVSVVTMVLNAVYLETNPPRRPWKYLYPIVPVVMVLGAIYTVFYFQDLVFVIEDTIRFGPD